MGDYCLVVGSAFLSTAFLRVFLAHSQTVRGPGVGVGFEEPRLWLMVLFVEPEFPLISHISAYATHQGELVLRYGLERPVSIRI